MAEQSKKEQYDAGVSDALARKNKKTMITMFSVVAGMVGLAYASVPLYELFCQVTGFGGTPQVAEDASDIVISDRKITIRFDATTNPALPWKFEPSQGPVTLPIGAESLGFYEATNLSDQPVTGAATFNVTPLKAGPYFVKMECFCFVEQTLQPGQSVDMPVSFFVDPEILEDPNLQDVKTITLSYTFFRQEDTQVSEADDHEQNY